VLTLGDVGRESPPIAANLFLGSDIDLVNWGVVYSQHDMDGGRAALDFRIFHFSSRPLGLAGANRKSLE